jgi:hypothetical protein
MSDSLNEIEQEILQLSYTAEVSGMAIAERLAKVEDQDLWRNEVDEDGRTITSFKRYLRHLAQKLRDQGIKASEGTFERLLSFYRLYHETLGFSLKDIMLIGITNLDIVRRLIDWNYRERTIGPGGNGKIGEEQAVEYLNKLLEEAQEEGVLTHALRDEVDKALGRTPLSIQFVFRRKDNLYYLTDFQIWEGGTVYRPREGIPEEKKNWLGVRCRAAIREVE